MLGKLIKNEFKQTARSVVSIYCAALGAMLFMVLSYVVKVTWIGILGSVALVIIGGLCIVMTLITSTNNFNRSLYGNQGYLSFALPVKGGNLLFSKFIVATIWMLISYLAFIATLVVVYFYAKVKSNGLTDGLAGMMSEFEFLAQLPSKALIVKFLVIIAIGLFFNVATFISYIYFSVTIANTRPLQKHPLAFGLVIFMLVYGAVQAINVKLTYSFPLSVIVKTDDVTFGMKAMSDAAAENTLFAFGISGVLFTVLISCVLLWVTGWIMENKVNVK